MYRNYSIKTRIKKANKHGYNIKKQYLSARYARFPRMSDSRIKLYVFTTLLLFNPYYFTPSSESFLGFETVISLNLNKQMN